MKDNASMFFAIILLLCGGLIVGKTLLRRQNLAATPEITCPQTNLVQLTPEVREYIEQKTPFTQQAGMAGADLLKRVEELEAELKTVSLTFAKSKEFIGRVDRLEKEMNDAASSREDRLARGRWEHGNAILEKATQKCGNTKPSELPKVNPPGTPPPQEKPAQ